jgi:intracellular sulfur oxidation DsrE/DsrF family protein
MKTIFYTSLVLLLAVFSSSLNAQTIEGNGKMNYVILIKKIPQLQPILLTAAALKKEDGEHYGDFQVIICGKEIGDITDMKKMKDFIQRAEKAGVQLVACGFSLNKFKVDQSKVPKEMKTVENGILYNLQLQKKGYLSLSL